MNEKRKKIFGAKDGSLRLPRSPPCNTVDTKTYTKLQFKSSDIGIKMKIGVGLHLVELDQHRYLLYIENIDNDLVRPCEGPNLAHCGGFSGWDKIPTFANFSYSESSSKYTHTHTHYAGHA